MPNQFVIPDDVVNRVRDKQDSLRIDAYSSYMELIHNEHIIVVNDGYKLGSWPDICFFGDHGWYKIHRQLLAQWTGLKITCCPALKENSDGIKWLRRDPDRKLGLSENPRRLAWGLNSGSSAINLAVHLGVRQVILLGFDMQHQPGQIHWHQGHGNERRPDGSLRPGPNYAKWMQGLAIMAKDAIRLGVEIINCSPGTAITAFPVANIREVL